jgi:hypothetical protein
MCLACSFRTPPPFIIYGRELSFLTTCQCFIYYLNLLPLISIVFINYEARSIQYLITVDCIMNGMEQSLHEKLDKKLYGFYGIWRFITAPTSPSLALNLATWIQCTPSHHMSERHILTTSITLTWISCTWLLPFSFSGQNSVCISHLSHGATCPAHYLLCLYRPNNVWWGQLVIKHGKGILPESSLADSRVSWLRILRSESNFNQN